MGVFVVIEGPDGSGKTTLTGMVREYLSKEGYRVRWERQPTPFLNPLIREILAGRFIQHRDATLGLLFAADRLQITPPQADEILLCDRDVLSSMVYQGSELGEDWIRRINHYALPYDLQIVLLPTPAEQANRLQGRDLTEIYETNPTYYLERYASYIAPRTHFVRNDQSLEEMTQRLITLIKEQVGLPAPQV